MSSKSWNLAEECGPLPSGTDLAGYNGYTANLTIEVTASLFLSGKPMAWTLVVEKPTITKSGRKGKPKKVLSLCANEGESVPDLLRQLAAMWDIGEVVAGESYEPIGATGGIDDPR